MTVPVARRARLDLVAAGARLAGAGLILPGEGNLSVRLDDELLLTPRGADKGRLRPVDLVAVAWPGGVLPPEASTEAELHLEVYRRLPEVRAVVHAHPPRVLALAARGRMPRWDLLAEGREVLGGVGWVGVLPPGSHELAEGAAGVLGVMPACVLEAHGAVTTGRDLAEALFRMLLLERLADLTLELKR